MSKHKPNGKDFYNLITEHFKEIRKQYPDIADEMLDANGAIYYMNGNDGTSFDWEANSRLCEFYIYYKSELGFIKVCVKADETVDTYAYNDYAENVEETSLKPIYKQTDRLQSLVEKYCTDVDGNMFSIDFGNLMYQIADREYKYDKPIDNLNWNIDMNKVYDILNEDEEAW